MLRLEYILCTPKAEQWQSEQIFILIFRERGIFGRGKDENIEIQTDREIDSSEDRTSCNEGDSETIDISEEKTGPGAIDQKLAVQKIHVSSHEEADKVSKELAERHGDGWKCKHCGRISITKERNKIHILSHLEGVEYSCRYCPKSYSTRNSLHVHTSINHRRE